MPAKEVVTCKPTGCFPLLNNRTSHVPKAAQAFVEATVRTTCGDFQDISWKKCDGGNAVIEKWTRLKWNCRTEPHHCGVVVIPKEFAFDESNAQKTIAATTAPKINHRTTEVAATKAEAAS